MFFPTVPTSVDSHPEQQEEQDLQQVCTEVVAGEEQDVTSIETGAVATNV